MKNINVKKIVAGIISLPLLLLFVTSCFDITGVTQPASAKVGDTITITVNVNYDSESTDQKHRLLVFGMLAPKSWKVAQNATVRYDSPSADVDAAMPLDGTMSVDPVTATYTWANGSRGFDGNKTGNTWTEDMNALLPIGENYGEVEWVAWRSDEKINASQITFDGTVTVTVKVGDGHTAAQLGYVVAVHNQGFKKEDVPADQAHAGKDVQSRFWDTFYANIAVTGTGSDSTDLLGPAPTKTASMAPEQFMFDDIVTLTFDAKEGKDGANTALFNANEVHANTKVKLADGTIVAGTAAKMTLTGNNIWSVTMWPPGFFGVADGNIITELHVNFSNPDGSVVVKNPEFGTDIVFVPNCQ